MLLGHLLLHSASLATSCLSFVPTDVPIPRFPPNHVAVYDLMCNSTEKGRIVERPKERTLQSKIASLNIDKPSVNCCQTVLNKHEGGGVWLHLSWVPASQCNRVLLRIIRQGAKPQILHGKVACVAGCSWESNALWTAGSRGWRRLGMARGS